MSMLAQATGSAFHSALTGLAMQFGIVPGGIDGKGFVFGSIYEPQARLSPLVNIDGTPENTSRIGGFPPIRATGEGEACRFHRDWLHITSMLDLPVRSLVYGMDVSAREKAQRLPKGFMPEDESIWDGQVEGGTRQPALDEFEILTVRQVLEMLAKGAANVARIREVGGHLYLMGRQETRRSFSVSLFFVSGVLLSRTNNKIAMQSLENAAARLPEDYDSGRAILYEMAADNMDNDIGRRSVARQWLKALKDDPDPISHDIKLSRAMWNAWRARDLGLMRDLMNIYMMSRRMAGDSIGVARALVRTAWYSSEEAEGRGGSDDARMMRTSSRTILDVASSIFKRAGDEGSAERALEVADTVDG